MWYDTVEEVGDGIVRLPLVIPDDPLLAVNVYLVEVADSLVMIDAGWSSPANLAAVEHAVRRMGRRLKDIRTIAVTHVHYDHVSMATELIRLSDADLAIGCGEWPNYQAARRGPELFRRDQRRIMAASGAPHHVQSSDPQPRAHRGWVDASTWLTPGEEIQLDGEAVLHAISTPGHTQGHMSFQYCRDPSLLFAGDHLLPHITPSIGIEAFPTSYPLAAYLSSLQRISLYGFNCVLPAHGHVFSHGSERALELIAHHRSRLDECATVVGESAGCSAWDVANALRWTRKQVSLASLPPDHQILAIREVLAHLELLVLCGSIEERIASHGRVRRWSPAERGDASETD